MWCGLRERGDLEEAVGILRRYFEMNRYQARAYIAVLRGYRTARDVSRMAGIPLSRVYDVLGSLEQAGLVRRGEDGYAAMEPGTALRSRLERMRENFEREYGERMIGLERFLATVSSLRRRDVVVGDSAVIRGLDGVMVKMMEACGQAGDLVFTVRRAVKLKEEFKRVLERLPRKKVLFLIHPSVELDSDDLEFLERIGARISRSSAVLLDMLVTDRGEALIGLPLDDDEPVVVWVRHEGFAGSLHRAVLEEAGLG
jgi:sugar-specific transcriptional regulator TrmB